MKVMFKDMREDQHNSFRLGIRVVNIRFFEIRKLSDHIKTVKGTMLQSDDDATAPRRVDRSDGKPK